MVDWPSIVEQYGPCVWQTAYRLLSDREEASDCYQETFVRALEFSRREEVACWPALLKRMATSRALDRLRQRYRRPCENLGDGEAAIVDPGLRGDGLEEAELLGQLRHLLAELPEQQATVFWLSEIEKLSHQEIASQLGANSQQVATWLHRAKQKLRRLFVERGMVEEIEK